VASNPDRSSYFPAIEKKHGQPMSYWFDQLDQRKEQKYAEQMTWLQEAHGFSRAHANALILYCKGSKSSRRFDTLDDYLASVDEVKAQTLRTIFDVLSKKFRKAEVVIAWNQPMLKLDDRYVFGASALTNHLLIAPFNSEVLQELAPRLTDYVVNKKTVRVPVDWKVDRKLLIDMVALQD